MYEPHSLPPSLRSSRSNIMLEDDLVGNQSVDELLKDLKEKLRFLWSVFAPAQYNPAVKHVVTAIKEAAAVADLIGEQSNQSAGDQSATIQKMADINLRIGKMIEQLDDKDKTIKQLQEEIKKLKGEE